MTQLKNEIISVWQDIHRPEYSEAAKFAASCSAIVGVFFWCALLMLFT